VSRVAITTAADRADLAARPYRARGLDPVLLPCVRIDTGPDSAIADIRQQAPGATWLVVTSARAVAIVWPDGAMPPVPVAAVGPVTARAVSEAGGIVALVGEAGASDLVEALGQGTGVVVFPHAAGTDPGVFEEIITAGWDLLERTVYEAVPVAPSNDDVDAVVFASPSAVQGWVMTRRLDGPVVGAIGPTTARVLRGHGRVPDLIADPPSHEGLARLMAAHLAERVDT
jgi:uroporphyrinogen-III synthase